MEIVTERRALELEETTFVRYRLLEIKRKPDSTDDMERDWYELCPTLMRRFFIAAENPVVQCAQTFGNLAQLPACTKEALRDAVVALPNADDKRAVIKALREFGSLDDMKDDVRLAFHAIVHALGEERTVYWEAVAQWLHLLAWIEEARARIESLSQDTLTRESWKIETIKERVYRALR